MKKSFTLSRKGKNKLMKTKRALVNAASDVKDTLAHAPSKVTVYVKENPYKSFGMTLFTGLLLSQLIRLRHLRR